MPVVHANMEILTSVPLVLIPLLYLLREYADALTEKTFKIIIVGIFHQDAWFIAVTVTVVRAIMNFITIQRIDNVTAEMG